MTDAVEVRRATEDEIAEIWQLTHDEYLRRGFIDKQPGGVFSHYSHLEWTPETTQLVAIVDGDLIGTCTYTMDGARKLHTDVDHPKETELIRKLGIPLVSVWRIVVDRRFRESHKVSQELMRATARELMDRGEPILLMTCHPRHAMYYTRRLGFQALANKDQSDGLKHAPSALMVGGPGSYSRIC